jgi:hypothetical protein
MITNLKSPEKCFLEILEYINVNFSNGYNVIEDNSNIFTNVINYSRYFRNETNHLNHPLCNKQINYVFQGDIPLNDTFYMHFYFSNQRSYVSIDVLNDRVNLEDCIAEIQLITYKYTEILYRYYNIDEFIYNLISKM